MSTFAFLVCPNHGLYLFDRLFHDVSNDRDSASLTQANSSTNRLCFNGRVPLWFDEVDLSRCSEVEPGTLSVERRNDEA